MVTLEFRVAVAFLEGLQNQKFPGEVVILIWGWGGGRNKLINFCVRLLFKYVQEHTNKKQNKTKNHNQTKFCVQRLSVFLGVHAQGYTPLICF